MDTVVVDGIEMKAYAIPTPHTVILVIRAEKGLLGCGYISLAPAEKLHDALAVVTGVSSCEDMLAAEVRQVSEAARELGIVPGMTGREALLKLS